MSQIKTRFITADAIDDTLIRLRNNQYMRARNAADSGDINTFKVNASNVVEFASLIQSPGTASANNDVVNKGYADGQYINKGGTLAFTADQSFGGFKATNVATPTASGDAATKGYVDSLVNGLDWKASVRAATTVAGTLASSFENGDAIDGVTLATGDRILIKDQASGSENGIYIVQASGAPVRASDADSSAEVTTGCATFVEEGTANGDTGFVLTTDGPIVLGTTALVFTAFTSQTILAGAGLTKTGNTIDVVPGDTSITVNANDLVVNLASNGGLEVSSGVKIKPDTTTANTLAITLTANGAGVKYDSASFSESTESLTLAAGVAGAGLALTAGVLSVGVDGLTTKIASDQVVGLTPKKELFTLNGTNITNQYIDLAQVAATDSILFMVKGAGSLLEGAAHDYSVSYTGGAGGKTRITFLNDLATGGNAALISGDIVQVSYQYL